MRRARPPATFPHDYRRIGRLQLLVDGKGAFDGGGCDRLFNRVGDRLRFGRWGRVTAAAIFSRAYRPLPSNNHRKSCEAPSGLSGDLPAVGAAGELDHSASRAAIGVFHLDPIPRWARPVRCKDDGSSAIYRSAAELPPRMALDRYKNESLGQDPPRSGSRYRRGMRPGSGNPWR
jgi:hypothetical protein